MPQTTSQATPSKAKIRMMRRRAERAADDLADVMDVFPGAFDGADRDAIGVIRDILDSIAEGDYFPVGLTPPPMPEVDKAHR